MDNNATFINKEGKEIYRQPVSAFSRVMGYLSPLSVPVAGIKGGDEVKECDKGKGVRIFRYNIGKRSEFLSRMYFDKDKAANHVYMDYGSSCGSNEHIEHAAKQTANIIVSNREFIKQYV